MRWDAISSSMWECIFEEPGFLVYSLKNQKYVKVQVCVPENCVSLKIVKIQVCVP